jgi:phospholipid/cholesterol/gamma-HCH transport system substrate-binding protein
MKRRNEFLVGLTVLAGLALIVGAALWLSEADIGHRQHLHTARFRTVGSVTVGTPVTFRGVRVGRVEAIRLAQENWVEADLRVYEGVELPPHPAAIAASRSLFGDWAITVVSRDQPTDDPNIARLLDEAAAVGGDVWPGATLPDVGQLTAQAGRIASDIASLTNRIQETFDSTAVRELRGSIKDFSETIHQLTEFTKTQTSRLDQVTGNVRNTSEAVADASANLRTTLARIDSATSDGQLQDILNATRGSTADIRESAANLRHLMEAAREHETSLIHVLLAADSLMTKIQAGQGTLGMLATDSTLYRETTATIVQFRQLLLDIQANPRKYFKFSVF